jgi:hypothetical protein
MPVALRDEDAMSTRTRKTNVSGKGCATIICIFLVLVGLAATIAVAGMIKESVASQFWKPTPAVILTSSLARERGDDVLTVSYLYTYEGRDYTGTRLKPSGNRFDDAQDALRAQSRYKSDRKAICYVNPSDPSQSYLQKDSVFFGLFILIPGAFLAFGIIGLITVWRYKPPTGRAMSSRAPGYSGTLALRIFGAIFMLVGGGVTYALSIHPWLQAREAANWREVPCRITHSEVDSHTGSKGSRTYSLDIRYDYEFEGETYASGRYDFTVGSSSNREWRDAVVRANRVGSQRVCYVNPADPSDAVLNREITFNW